jgi:hypothetical protein
MGLGERVLGLGGMLVVLANGPLLTGVDFRATIHFLFDLKKILFLTKNYIKKSFYVGKIWYKTPYFLALVKTHYSIVFLSSIIIILCYDCHNTPHP